MACCKGSKSDTTSIIMIMKALQIHFDDEYAKKMATSKHR